MPRLLGSKSPPDISTRTPPTELVKDLASQRDSRTLAATSTAIALSLGSAFYDTRDTSGDGPTVRGRSAHWQTAYGAARMAVEIANASSDLLLPLKAVVGAMSILIKNYDQTVDNAEGIKEIERRVESLSGVLASPVGEDDHAEKERRAKLQRKLEEVITKLEPLSDQHALIRFFHNIDNTKTLSGFVQELANAVTDYQVSIQQGVYERTRNIHDGIGGVRDDTKNILGDTENILDDTKNILEAADLEILAKLEPVRNAGYQAGHHDKCLPGTRRSVLQDMMSWARNPPDQNVFWLNGLAGTGKSTIAQSFSEAVANEGILGASFFCSRDYLDRRELKNIFPTLAYQLACHYPHFRSHVVTVIKKDPTLAHTSLILQLENLIVNPLSGKNIPCVIVIDALDECIDDQPASAILSVLGRFAKQLPLVKFFITGRPEPRIRSGFRLPLLEPLTQVFLLHEVELSSVDNDIHLYLTQRLTTIAKRRSDLELPDPWPRDDEIKALTKKASGLFIFASTLARFIESEHHNPSERLRLVLSKASGTMHEGRAGIDSLYSQVLSHAFSDVGESDVFSNVKRVLGAIVLAFNPLSRRDLSTILGISTTLISTTLRHLHSVVLVPPDEYKEIRIFHKSFPDFLQDEKRCTDPRFCVDPATHHKDMVLGCLELVKKLKRNPCSLPPFVINHDVPNLPQLLENKLGGAARYACRYWAKHLHLSPKSGNYVRQVAISATEMLKSAPPWIEVMSLENHLEEVIHSMHGLLDWLDEVVPIVRENVDVARQIADTAEQNAAATWWNANAAQQNAKTARQNANIARQIAKSIVLVTTPLYDFAMDCLRLSMHFYHPIQQCAQQIYHTALPLSPSSSLLRQSCLQNAINDRLSRVVVVTGGPNTWGSLLRTIDVGQRQLTCIATSFQRIVAACEGVVTVYDAVTGMLRQSLYAPGAVAKIQDSPDGTILFFAHTLSVTMWDVQTGGLIHTFTTRSEINDIAVSTTGDHISCGLSDGSVVFWDTYTKEGDKGFKDGHPIVTIHWLSPVELAIATRNSLYIGNTALTRTSNNLSFPGHMWGMVYMGSDEFLVGTSLPGADRELCSLEIISHRRPDPHQSSTDLGQLTRQRTVRERRPPMDHKQLTRPTRVGNDVLCITPPSGVQSFDINSHNWTGDLPLLDAATSVAVSLNRNLVVQTDDSIQIFSLDVLKTGKTRDGVRLSHVYPLGEKHVVCLQPNRHITLLELETLREVHPEDVPLPLRSSFTNQLSSVHASFSRGFVAEFGISVVMQAWQSGTPLPEWTETAEEGGPLSELSPNCTRIVTVYGAPRRELRVTDGKDRSILANLSLADDDLGTGKVYDLTFDSETRFHLKVDGPGWHIQVPYDIIPSPSGSYSHTITQGEPVSLSEPRVESPYTLDANCEWVLDAESRKICWISPVDLRRGSGGHFWAGLSLVMVGDDGIVRKVTFEEPDR